MLSPTTPYIYPGMQTAAIRTNPMSPPIFVTSPGSRPGTPDEVINEPNKHAYEVDDEFNIPVSLALLILMLYMMAGAFIFSYTDGWSLFDSFYFVYISISTIGFGDMTPETEMTMILASIYLLFGLALTSMVINVIQEKLADVFEETKLRLAVKMGLDAQQMMQEEIDKNADKNSEKSASKSSLDSKNSSSTKSSKKEKEKEKQAAKKEAKKIAKENAIKKKESEKLNQTNQANQGDPKVPRAAPVTQNNLQPVPPRVGFSLINEDIGRRMKERRKKAGLESPTSISSNDESPSCDENSNVRDSHDDNTDSEQPAGHDSGRDTSQDKDAKSGDDNRSDDDDVPMIS